MPASPPKRRSRISPTSASPPSSCCPIHHIADEQALADKGLTNYWGYSSIGYLAPHAGYSATGSTGDQVREFKGMVKALHRAGIEVILDVVYNHTAEGNHLGPMLSFKGIDNLSYYRTVPETPRFYMDYTGTGNSLNPAHPSVLRLIMDSLRYFVIECHVDGFRFDLASALAREFHEVDRLSAFFDIIHQDPVLSQVKLIAEPWDVGEGGYQVGNFPVLWTEWNGIYRDTMRDFWRGEAVVGDFASRFTGSSDLYQQDGRKPFASINFITAHDGFTLRDLVSYNEKHNEANLEGNRDGDNHNRSWNHGVEGETDDPAINELRDRQMRNFLATLLLSQGVPMLLGGDEFARTQHGNNNAYCQDNELSWLDWELDERQRRLHAFTKRLIEFRRRHPVFRRADFLTGEERLGSGSPDVWWFRPDGRKMTIANWRRGDTHTLGVLLNGAEIPTVTAQGAPVMDDTFLILFNADPERDRVHAAGGLVRAALGLRALDGRARGRARRRDLPARGVVPVEGRSLGDAAPHRLSGGLPLHVPAAARAWISTSRARGRSSRTSATSASRTSTSRPRCRPARARRTATTSSTRRGSRSRSAVRRGSGRCARRRPRRGSASCSTSSRTTWRRRTRTRSGATRSGARASSTSTGARARTAASSTSASSPGCGWRIPRSGSHAREGDRAGARRARRRGADRPSRRSRAAAPLPRAAAGGRDRARLGREDPRARRAAAATGRWRGRPATSS